MKNSYLMKVALLFPVVYFMNAQASSAQNHCNLQLTIIAPVNNEEIAFGDTATLQYSIKNLGPEDITGQDTLYLSMEDFPILTSLHENIDVGDSVVYPYLSIWNDAEGDFSFDACIYLRADLNESVTDSIQANDTSCVHFILKGSGTGIFEFQNNNQNNLVLYPNPATNEVMLSLNRDKPKGQISVLVKDCLGRTCLQRQYSRPELLNVTAIKLDISSLNNGIYFVELDEGNAKSIGKLMVR